MAKTDRKGNGTYLSDTPCPTCKTSVRRVSRGDCYECCLFKDRCTRRWSRLVCQFKKEGFTVASSKHVRKQVRVLLKLNADGFTLGDLLSGKLERDHEIGFAFLSGKVSDRVLLQHYDDPRNWRFTFRSDNQRKHSALPLDHDLTLIDCPATIDAYLFWLELGYDFTGCHDNPKANELLKRKLSKRAK